MFAILGFPGHLVSNMLNFFVAGIDGAIGDFRDALFTATGGVGDRIAETGALRANPITYLLGVAISTWSYTLNQAAHADYSDPQGTWNYALRNPGVVVQETAKAVVQVGVQVVATVLGPLGGILGWFR
jgi:hypothetical protein